MPNTTLGDDFNRTIRDSFNYLHKIREENTNSECPVCHEPNVSPDDLIPSRKTRLAVLKFRNSQPALAVAVPPAENNEIKKPKILETQNKMPSLPDIPGITVPVKGNVLMVLIFKPL